jgi:hypothetical protein
MTAITIPEGADAEQVWKIAQPLIRADYVRWIRERAAEIVKEHPDADDQNDAVHDVVDGSWWTTYTHASLMVLASTNNDDAFLEDYGTEALGRIHGSDASAAQLYAQLAYGAMERDLMEELDRLNEEAKGREDEPVTPDRSG